MHFTFFIYTYLESQTDNRRCRPYKNINNENINDKNINDENTNNENNKEESSNLFSVDLNIFENWFEKWL